MTQPILKNLAQLERQEINAVVTLILLSGAFAFTLSLANIFLSLIISTLIILTYVSLRTITTRKHNNVQFELIYNLQKELQKSLIDTKNKVFQTNGKLVEIEKDIKLIKIEMVKLK